MRTSGQLHRLRRNSSPMSEWDVIRTEKQSASRQGLGPAWNRFRAVWSLNGQANDRQLAGKGPVNSHRRLATQALYEEFERSSFGLTFCSNTKESLQFGHAEH